ncbi:MAG: hypothetical protein RSB71_00435 [Bacilli bacterium]
MKKKYFGLFIICLMLIPVFNVKAFGNDSINIDNEVHVNKDINGSAILAGNNVNYDKNIAGIGLMLGNNINYKGQMEYAFLAGNNLNITGKVSKDGFVVGNIINFEKDFKIDRDLFVFGDTVTLKGNITRDVIIYAENVIISDVNITGNVKLIANKIEVKEDAKINGSFSYNKDAKVNIMATITNTILLDEAYKTVTFKEKAYNLLMSYSGMLVIFVFLALVVPALFKRIEKKTEKLSLLKIFAMTGFGALGLIVMPIIFVLLCSLIFGISLALLLLVLYIIVICLSSLFTGYLLGLIIWRKFIKKDINTLLVGLIGITLLTILTLIPYVGSVFTLFSLLIGVGIVGYLFKKD